MPDDTYDVSPLVPEWDDIPEDDDAEAADAESEHDLDESVEDEA